MENYARFYTLLKRMPYEGDKEDLKRELVSQGTNGRTESLKDVTPREYAVICEAMERTVPAQKDRGYVEERRRERSICLKLMQQIGVDTTDWTAINSYCQSPKIAGKVFRDLSVEELHQLSLRLRMILKKCTMHNA